MLYISAWAILALLVQAVMGNAKASECGTSNWYRFPRFFFLYGLVIICFEPSGAGSLLERNTLRINMTPYEEYIYNNPFRILGVYANASIRDIKANEAKAKAFLNVGREVTYPCDFNQLLSPIQRTAEMMASANSQLTLPNEKIKHALFWFVKVTPLDEIAFNHLANGNTSQAIDIWEKKKCFSSLLNISVLSLIQGQFIYSVQNMIELLGTETFRNDFIRTIIDDTFQISEDVLAHTFLDVFTNPAYVKALLSDSILPNKYKGYIKDKLVVPTIADIESEITKAKSIKRENSSARYNAGAQLMNLAKNKLAELKRLLVGNDMRYQIIADKLGLEILQCGIDYYNNSDDADAAHKAMKLQSYAQSVVVGQMAKDRCKQNTDILKKIIAELPPMEVINEDRAIRKELEKFCKLPDRIQYAIDLLNNTRPYLTTIKNRLGNTNGFYLKLSTQVIGNALHNLIEEINNIQKFIEQDIEKRLKEQHLGFHPSTMKVMKDSLIAAALPALLKPALENAWKAIRLMDGFDIEYDFKTNRYNANRATLKDMCEQMGISTSTYIPKPSNISNPQPISNPPKTPTKKTTKELNIFIAVIIIHLIWGIGSIMGGNDFWEGFFIGIVGWLVGVNYIGYFILDFIYKKINE